MGQQQQQRRHRQLNESFHFPHGQGQQARLTHTHTHTHVQWLTVYLNQHLFETLTAYKRCTKHVIKIIEKHIYFMFQISIGVRLLHHRKC